MEYSCGFAGVEVEPPTIHQPSSPTPSCTLDLEAGVGWFGVFLELLGAFSEAELVGVE